MSGDELGTAVCAIDVEAVTRLLTGGHDPNAARAPGGEDAFQPDRPLKMVMFRLSDSMLGDAERAQLAAIARILLAHGADPAPAMAIAEYRYGAYQGKDDAATWAAWHVVAAAASPYAVAERAVIKLQSTREVILAKAGKRPSSAAARAARSGQTVLSSTKLCAPHATDRGRVLPQDPRHRMRSQYQQDQPTVRD